MLRYLRKQVFDGKLVSLVFFNSSSFFSRNYIAWEKNRTWQANKLFKLVEYTECSPWNWEQKDMRWVLWTLRLPLRSVPEAPSHIELNTISASSKYCYTWIIHLWTSSMRILQKYCHPRFTTGPFIDANKKTQIVNANTQRWLNLRDLTGHSEFITWYPWTAPYLCAWKDASVDRCWVLWASS